MVSWFSNSTSLICLLESWRRQPCADQPKPRRAGRRIRVGLPTPDKSQKTGRTALPWCSLPSINSSHLRAISHCHNSISKQAYRRSQLLLHWTSHRWDRDSTSLLGTTRPQPQREFRSSTSLLGTTSLHLQGHLISRDDQAQGQDAPDVPDAPIPDAPTVHDIATPIEERFGSIVDVTHQCTPCLVRHATWLLNRFQRRQSGATAFENLKRVSHKKPLLQFGERCHAGVWLGRHTASDAHLIGTPGGVIQVRTVRRLTP